MGPTLGIFDDKAF